MRLLVWILFLAMMLGLFALIIDMPPARAEQNCQLLAPIEARVVDGGGAWVELAPPQLQFMRGAYANVPGTKGQVPIGDKAFLGGGGKEEKISVYFVDGAFVCGKLNITPTLLDTLLGPGAGESAHLGDPS